MTTQIIDLSEARKQKKEKEYQEQQKKIPQDVADYIALRNTQISHLENLARDIIEFQKNKLTFSKKSKLIGPEIDNYLDMLAILNIGKENIKYNDRRVQELYPNIELVPIEKTPQ